MLLLCTSYFRYIYKYYARNAFVDVFSTSVA